MLAGLLSAPQVWDKLRQGLEGEQGTITLVWRAICRTVGPARFLLATRGMQTLPKGAHCTRVPLAVGPERERTDLC